MMNIKPMKPFFSNMFRMVAQPTRSFTTTTSAKGLFSQHKTLDVLTLFHKPSSPASVRVHNLLKQASAQSSAAATEDQASDHSHQNKSVQRGPFELDVTEAEPTPDQLRSILEYIGAGKVGSLVKGASSEGDAMKILKQSADAFQRPVLVDWEQGRAVVGDDESAIQKLLKEGPKANN
jgi:arsenate reductase-like glutaredoxin family protein